MRIGIPMNHLLDIDFTGIDSQGRLHDLLKRVFGFPDFYGANFHALVDCWSSMRSPADGMSEFVLPDIADTVTIRARGLTTLDRDSLFVLAGAMEDVNARELRHGHSLMMFLAPMS